MNTLGLPSFRRAVLARLQGVLLLCVLALSSASAQAQRINPAVAKLNIATGGTLNFLFISPSPFLPARLCKDISPVPLGQVVRFRPDLCDGATATAPVLFARADAGTFTVTIPASALAATASSGSARPRFTHLVVNVSGPLGDGYAAVRIDLIEPSRGPELTEMQLRFVQRGSRQAIGFFELGQRLPPIEALLRFTGNGLLRARWEVVTPDDPQPTAFDLTLEPYLSLQDRARQYRWRLLSRVQTYLSAPGLTRVPGPDPRTLPSDRFGAYTVLLRIEPGSPLDPALGTPAPFLLPVLRYYIGDSAALLAHPAQAAPTEPIEALAPQGLVFSDRPLVFTWQVRPDVTLYRVELLQAGRTVYAARVQADTPGSNGRFELPAFAMAGLGKRPLCWRVVAVGADGGGLNASRCVDLQWATVR